LDKLLARPTRVRTVRHHPALPYAELPAFMLELAGQKGLAARALTFCILTASRTGEVIGARWSEIDGDVWTIPGTRMKSGREHRVPLSLPARQIVEELRALPGDADGFVFPGGRAGKPLSNMAMTAVLGRMGRSQITAHGFRSCFRDWARESTNFPREVAETALAHILKDKVEAAYARGDLLDKRRELMDAWADYALSQAVGTAATGWSRAATNGCTPTS
jgi:integrase